MMKKENQKLSQRGINQLIIIIIGALLILGIGGIAVFMSKKTKSLESEIEALKSREARSTEEKEDILKGQAGDTLTPSKEGQTEIEKVTQPEKPETVIKLEKATGNKRTKTFTVEEPGLAIEFYVALDEFPSIDKPASYKISLYKVGESNPLWTHQDEITRKELEDRGWSPEWTGMGSHPAGTVGGIVGPIISSQTGEFYFEVKVKNVDRWYLEVNKSPS